MFAGLTIAWVRVGIAAVLSEVVVMAAIGLGIFAHRLVRGKESSTGSSPSLGERVGYYVAPPAAFVAVFGCALWAIRSLSTGYILNGLLVGLGSVLLTLGFALGARPEHRLMYGVSFLLRLIGGVLAGAIASRS